MGLYRYQEEEIEWRSPQDALALDLSLLEDVFRRLARQRHAANGLKTNEHAASSLSTSNQTNHDAESSTLMDNQASVPRSCFHPEMLFSKSDVLVTLERSPGFLSKRKMLRMLHTTLACVSLEKEGASVQGFVRFRVKERTLSFSMARAKLLAIFERTQRAVEFQAQVELFTQQARAKSLWCVRDPKSICQRPSQLYAVHVLPVKPKTQKQLDAEQKVLEAVAAAVVSNALQLSMGKIVNQVVQSHPASGSGRRSARTGRTAHSALTGEDDGENSGLDSRMARRGGPSKLALRAKAKRESAETEARRRQLRLQIFLAPSVDNAKSMSPVFSPSRQSSKPHEKPKAVMNDEGDDELELGEDEVTLDQLDGTLEGHQTDGIAKKKPTRSKRLLLLLATVEANGDSRIAERLAYQKITSSGFQRALEQAKNLGLAREDHWGIVKTWKTVYRSHTVQSLQSAMSK
ncbi:hypothetical protein Gpo141_00004249 [Globisporangium polare]